MTEPDTENRHPQKSSIAARLLKSALRLFFKLLYHPLAWSYDLVASAVSVGRWQTWVLATAELLDGQRILELGYGPGHLQLHLHQRGKNAVGLDESRQMAKQAAQRLRKAGYAPRLARGLAQHLPYPGATFDNVAATFPTPYIIDPQTLESIERVLIPGGKLVVLMAAWVTGTRLHERAVRTLNRVTAETPPDDQDLSEYLKPYEKAGFQASLRFVENSGSRLMFIIAKKVKKTG